MKNTFIKSKKGFTIIEVVLVLAIAGLIFLMVFVALPNLQRTQRDTQRRNDVDRVSTSLTQYITNNNSLPAGTTDDSFDVEDMDDPGTAWEKFAVNYLIANGGDTFEDPNGVPYGLAALDCSVEDGCPDDDNPELLSSDFGTGADGGLIVVAKNASCGNNVDTRAFVPVTGNRKFAVAMKLEGNGIYCVDNS